MHWIKPISVCLSRFTAMPTGRGGVSPFPGALNLITTHRLRQGRGYFKSLFAGLDYEVEFVSEPYQMEVRWSTIYRLHDPMRMRMTGVRMQSTRAYVQSNGALMQSSLMYLRYPGIYVIWQLVHLRSTWNLCTVVSSLSPMHWYSSSKDLNVSTAHLSSSTVEKCSSTELPGALNPFSR